MQAAVLSARNAAPNAAPQPPDDAWGVVGKRLGNRSGPVGKRPGHRSLAGVLHHRITRNVSLEPGRRLVREMVPKIDNPEWRQHPEDLAHRMAELVDTYADLPLGSTDSSVIALAERLGAVDVATLDRRDFSVVRPRHVGALTLLP